MGGCKSLLTKHGQLVSNDIQKQIISSEEVDTNWDLSYKTSSEEVLYLKEQQQQAPFSAEDMLPVERQSLPVPRSSFNCLPDPFIHPALLVIGQASHWNLWPHPKAPLFFLLDCCMQGKYSFDSLRCLLLGALHDGLLVLIWHCLQGRHRWWMLMLLSTIEIFYDDRISNEGGCPLHLWRGQHGLLQLLCVLLDAILKCLGKLAALDARMSMLLPVIWAPLCPMLILAPGSQFFPSMWVKHIECLAVHVAAQPLPEVIACVAKIAHSEWGQFFDLFNPIFVCRLKLHCLQEFWLLFFGSFGSFFIKALCLFSFFSFFSGSVFFFCLLLWP